ncbi:hypothetical protein ACWFMI_23920 [Nocardiopsis terrae]|uniref:hypothetical protein n=1 Tax=Streptomyces sp. NPDC057554 TaxID=3350538 RepID=UPI003686AE94
MRIVPREDFRVIITPRRLGDLGFMRTSDVESDYQRRCEEIASQVRQTIADVDDVRVEWAEGEPVCSHCGLGWEVSDDEQVYEFPLGSPVCCQTAAGEWQAAQPGAVVYRVTDATSGEGYFTGGKLGEAELDFRQATEKLTGHQGTGATRTQKEHDRWTTAVHRLKEAEMRALVPLLPPQIELRYERHRLTYWRDTERPHAHGIGINPHNAYAAALRSVAIEADSNHTKD